MQLFPTFYSPAYKLQNATTSKLYCTLPIIAMPLPHAQRYNEMGTKFGGGAWGHLPACMDKCFPLF